MLPACNGGAVAPRGSHAIALLFAYGGPLALLSAHYAQRRGSNPANIDVCSGGRTPSPREQPQRELIFENGRTPLGILVVGFSTRHEVVRGMYAIPGHPEIAGRGFGGSRCTDLCRVTRTARQTKAAVRAGPGRGMPRWGWISRKLAPSRGAPEASRFRGRRSSLILRPDAARSDH